MNRISTLGLSFTFAIAASAQLTVTPNLTDTQVSDLLEGIGVTVTNVSIDCPGDAMGHFTGYSELGIQQGLVLTSGSVSSIAAPSSEFCSGNASTDGDADLSASTGGSPTYDACAVEFDCIPVGDTLGFNFAFGSEEYPEYVGSSFNDVFGIFMSGPGINGPFSNNAENIAWIPGTNVPVAINNVNATSNAAYFQDNAAGQYIAYDGFTTNLPVFAVVQPGESYHFKVVVADVYDGVLDSGVFLEAFSFRSAMKPLATEEVQRRDWSLVQLENEVLVNMPEGAGQQLVEVLDATGAVVAQRTSNGSRLSVPTGGLNAGLYFVRTLDGSATPLRFVKR